MGYDARQKSFAIVTSNSMREQRNTLVCAGDVRRDAIIIIVFTIIDTNSYRTYYIHATYWRDLDGIDNNNNVVHQRILYYI